MIVNDSGRHAPGRALVIAGVAALLGLLCAAAFASTPGPAGGHTSRAADDSGCGGVEVAYPKHRHAHHRPPLAIGDSTMLLALYDLAAAGYEANAHGCRQFPEALALLWARRHSHTLPHMVVIALGADGNVTRGDVQATLGILGRNRLLVLVTPLELGGWSGSDAATVRAAGREHRTRIKVLDWVRYAHGHGSWFQPDGVHLTTSGAHAFAHLLSRALRYANAPLRKRHRRVPTPARPAPVPPSPPVTPSAPGGTTV